jgi:hypothetical protein
MKIGLRIPAILALLILASCIPETNIESLEGSWNCEETSDIYIQGLKGTSTYPVYIAQDAEDDNTYYIDNFYQLGEGVQVKIKLSGISIMLGKQTVDGIEFQGTGTVNSSRDVINLSYTADDGGGQVDHVQAEYSR